MSIARIVAPLTGAKRDASLLATAFAAAKPFNAHVVALFVRPDPRLALPYGGVPISPDVVQEIINTAEDVNREAAAAAKAALDAACKLAGVAPLPSAGKGRVTTCSFLEMEGYLPRCVTEISRLSDLVVFGRVAPEDGPDLADAFVDTLKTERPVLIAAEPPAAFPGKAVLAWDDSPAAARALLGAMPFLKKAREIVLLSCHEPRAPRLNVENVQHYLALHGLSCTVQTADPRNNGVGETLLVMTSVLKADLLIMGGYGHSQLGEAIFGGVTQHVRWNATIPVLMVH